MKDSNLLPWRADIEGIAAGQRVELKAHPEFAQTLRGSLQRGAQRVELAGDLVAGELTLEESIDGTRIGATWKAQGMHSEHPFVQEKR